MKIEPAYTSVYKNGVLILLILRYYLTKLTRVVGLFVYAHVIRN